MLNFVQRSFLKSNLSIVNILFGRPFLADRSDSELSDLSLSLENSGSPLFNFYSTSNIPVKRGDYSMICSVFSSPKSSLSASFLYCILNIVI